MVSHALAVALFSCIEPGHPFYQQIEAFAAAIERHPRYAELAAMHTQASAASLHAEIKARPAGSGWSLERFYWSFQCHQATPAQSFQALTLVYAANTGQLTWHSFPDDPYLATVAPYLASTASLGVGQVEVLRYVPLRRLTFRLASRTSSAALIGKFMRRSRFRDAYTRLSMVAHGARRAGASFAVATPVAVDDRSCLFFQEALPGQSLPALADAHNLAGLLFQAGALHHELHSLPIADLPDWDASSSIARIEHDCAWITFVRPELSRLLGSALALLKRQVPAIDPTRYTFCHGDFACSQVLVGPAGWAVTDFDLAQRGDRYRELALLLASLPYDLPCLGAATPTTAALLEQASLAYCTGYQEQAGQALDQRRLLWHQLGAEIYYLALMLKKDWFQPPAFERAVERIRNYTGRLAPARGHR
ncbi:MAG: aminoglycoside phosphotransferase family protein [Kouleothrix sp.]|jgi:aminoglycoside phosphotransferase|nr:aminoglycoside phosphotransferase family protein [Kouleothrix sp.]